MGMNKTPGERPNWVVWGEGRPLPEPVEAGAGRTAVRLEPVAQGRDLLLVVTGGDAHVGAVAVCGPPVEGGPARPEVTVVPGHKEGPLAEECARALAEAAQCTCCVVAGIHQDEATPGEIAAIVENARQGLALIIRRIQSST